MKMMMKMNAQDSQWEDMKLDLSDDEEEPAAEPTGVVKLDI